MLTQPDLVNLGDYLQVYFTVIGNNSKKVTKLHKNGVFMSPVYVAFAAYGERIITQIDPAEVGFGGCDLPTGAMATPPADGRLEQRLSSAPPPARVAIAASAPPPPAPHYGVLGAPLVAPPQGYVLSAAADATYAAYLAAGWSDDQMVQRKILIPEGATI